MEKGNKCKFKEDWKELIRSSLTPYDFQELCRDILKNNNLKNVEITGRGPDGGCDIKAIRCSKKENNDERIEKIWVQCKRVKRGINFNDILKDLIKAKNAKVNDFFIMSNQDSTPTLKKDIENWNRNEKCEVFDWTGSKFLDSLWEQPSICQTYFPNEKIPPLFNPKEPENAIDFISNLGEKTGLELKFKTNDKSILGNTHKLAEFIKSNLLSMKIADPNIKSLVYSKISMFFFSMKKPDDAILFLNKSLSITPNNIDALLNKGYILEKSGKYEESNMCYDTVLKIDKSNKLALNNKSSNMNKQGKYKKALELINETLKIDDKFLLAMKNKINILKNLNRIDEALNLFEKNPELLKHTTLKIEKVNLLIENLDLKQAFILNEEILKEDPKNIDALNSKGVIYENNSQFQHREKYLKLSLNIFDKLTKENENYPVAITNKCIVLSRLNKKNEAIKVMDESYPKFTKNPLILNEKGRILLENGKYKEAIKYFDLALKIIHNSKFLLNKAYAQLGMRQWKNVIELCDNVLKYNNKNSDAWKLKGTALKKLRQKTRSNKCISNSKKYEKKVISLLEQPKTHTT